MNCVYLYFSAVFLSRVHIPLSGLGAGIWYQTNPVPDLHGTRIRNRRLKKMESIYGHGADFRSLCHGYYVLYERL